MRHRLILATIVAAIAPAVFAHGAVTVLSDRIVQPEPTRINVTEQLTIPSPAMRVITTAEPVRVERVIVPLSGPRSSILSLDMNAFDKVVLRRRAKKSRVKLRFRWRRSRGSYNVNCRSTGSSYGGAARVIIEDTPAAPAPATSHRPPRTRVRVDVSRL